MEKEEKKTNKQNGTLASAFNKVENIITKYKKYFVREQRIGRDKQVDNILDCLKDLKYTLEDALEKQDEYKKMSNGYYYPAVLIKEKDL